MDDSFETETANEILQRVNRVHRLLHIDPAAVLETCDRVINHPECSLILLERDNLAETAAAARRAETTLTRFGDTDRALKARLLVAAVHYKEGDYLAAQALFLSIAESMEEGGNRATLAGLLHNLADCEVRLGQFDARLDRGVEV